MSFAIITSHRNFLTTRSTGRDCNARICRPLTPDAYSGTAKQLFHRGIAFLGSSAVLFVVGALLTGLGYYAVLTHVARALGPMCIAMAMLLVIVAARYLTIARRLSELAEMAESQEITVNNNATTEEVPRRGRSTVVTIISESDATNANQNMNETYGFRFQQADFLPPPTYDSATQHDGSSSSNTRPTSPDTIPLAEQEPPPPYSEAIKTGPPEDDSPQYEPRNT